VDPRAQHEPVDSDPGPAQAGDAAAPDAAGRTPGPEATILVMLAGTVLAVLLGVVVGARLGTLTVAITLAAAGTWRATAHTGPPGLVVRSRGFDVLTCWGGAVVIGLLAITAPGVG
jgi:hypothetical protein